MVHGLFRLGGALPTAVPLSEPSETWSSSYRQRGEQRNVPEACRASSDMKGTLPFRAALAKN